MDIKDLKLIEKLKVKAVKAQQYELACHLRYVERELAELIKDDLLDAEKSKQFYCKDKVIDSKQPCSSQCDHCKIVEDTPTTT